MKNLAQMNDKMKRELVQTSQDAAVEPSASADVKVEEAKVDSA